MAKGIKEVLSDVKSLLKVIELILCIIGIIFVDLEVAFWDRWVMEMLVIGLGGYVLICSVLLIFCIMQEDPPELLDHLFMLVGAVLNILAGILTMMRNSQRHEFKAWFIVKPALHRESYTSYEIFVAIFAIAAGVVMLIDFIRSFLNKKSSE